MIFITISSDDILKIDTDLLLLSFFKDEVPLQGLAQYVDWIFCAHLSSLIKSEKISGRYKETTLLNGRRKVKADKILLLGLGKTTNFSASKLKDAYEYAAKAISDIKITKFGLGVRLEEIADSRYTEAAEAMLTGIFKGLNDSDADFYIKLSEDKERVDELKRTVLKIFKNDPSLKGKIENNVIS